MIYTKTGIISLYFMAFYITFFSFFIESSKRGKEFYQFLLVLIFSLFFGLRDVTIGVDTRVYVNSFLTETRWFEEAYLLFRDVVYYFTNNYKIYLFMNSFIMNLFVWKIYKKQISDKNSRTLSLLLFFSLPYGIQMNINVIRQGLAISLLIYGLTMNKKLSKYIIIMISLFTHKYTVFFLILYIISKFISLKKKRLLLMFFIALSVSGLNMKIVRLIPLPYINKTAIITTHQILMTVIKLLFYTTFYLIGENKSINNQENENNVFFSFYYILLLSGFLLSFNSIAVTRSIMVLDMVLPIIVFSDKDRKKSNNLLILLLVFIFFNFIIQSNMMRISFNWLE